ncbi:MAG TPA: thioredoxin domain-containing protein [Niastella sp.]
MLEALDKGIRSVPTLCINGEVYDGRLSQPEISKAIDSACSEAKRKRA